MKQYITSAKLRYYYKVQNDKVTVDSISTYLNKKEAHNIDNKSIIETLNQLQGKGLTNQLCRSIDTAIISKVSHSTPSQFLISPTAEHHVNGTSVNNIFYKLIPSINRSLPATPMAGINTIHRVLTIGISFLNTKLESLQSKLNVNIMAMKSYLMSSGFLQMK